MALSSFRGSSNRGRKMATRCAPGIRIRLPAFALYCAVLILGLGSRASAEFKVERVATGLSQPVYVTHAPGDTSRLFIVEANSSYNGAGGQQIARIKILNL